jgi:hypothetical protein
MGGCGWPHRGPTGAVWCAASIAPWPQPPRCARLLQQWPDQARPGTADRLRPGARGHPARQSAVLTPACSAARRGNCDDCSCLKCSHPLEDVQPLRLLVDLTGPACGCCTNDLRHRFGWSQQSYCGSPRAGTSGRRSGPASWSFWFSYSDEKAAPSRPKSERGAPSREHKSYLQSTHLQ